MDFSEEPIFDNIRQILKTTYFPTPLDSYSKEVSKTLQQYGAIIQFPKRTKQLHLSAQLVTAIPHSSWENLIKTPFVVRPPYTSRYNISPDTIATSSFQSVWEYLYMEHIKCKERQLPRGIKSMIQYDYEEVTVLIESEYVTKIRERPKQIQNQVDKNTTTHEWTTYIKPPISINAQLNAVNNTKVVITEDGKAEVLIVNPKSKTIPPMYSFRILASTKTYLSNVDPKFREYLTQIEEIQQEALLKKNEQDDTVATTTTTTTPSEPNTAIVRDRATREKLAKEKLLQEKLMKEKLKRSFIDKFLNNANSVIVYKGKKTIFSTGLWDIELFSLQAIDNPSTTIQRINITVNSKYMASVSNAYMRQITRVSSLFDEIIVSFVDLLRTIDNASRLTLPKRPSSLVLENDPKKHREM